MRVMIVDNDEAWTRSLTLLLKARGYEVHAFTNPSTACEFVHQIAETGFLGVSEMPDAVVLDYVMPEMSGFQVLNRIGDRLGETCTIVLVTGHGEQLRGARLTEMRVAACLEKPVDLDHLITVLERRAA